MSNLKQDAKQIYKQTWIESWVIGFLSGLLIVGFVSLGFLLPGIGFLLTPLVCLPILFSAQLSHMSIHYNGKITFTNALKQFFIYFTHPFNSSFSFFKSLLKALLVFLATELFLSIFASQILYLFNTDLEDSVVILEEYISDLSTFSMDGFLEILALNDYALLTYFKIAILPAYILAVAYFVYNILRNATNIFPRMNIQTDNIAFLKAVINHENRFNRRAMFKAWMSLNWPGIILYFVGSIGATVASFFFTNNPFMYLTVSVVGGLLMLCFYLPFYLCNQEALYNYFAPAYKVSADKVSEMAKQAALENARRAQEQKEYFDDLLKEMEKHQQNESDDVDNEKDPDNGST